MAPLLTHAQMILFDNSLIRLNYDPATDILLAECPDLHGYLLHEIKHSIDVLVDTAKNYDIKKLLLDSTNSVPSGKEEESMEVALYLATAIAKTRLQRMARVRPLSNTTEAKSLVQIRHIKEKHQFPFQLQSFSSRPEAISWLVTN